MRIGLITHCMPQCRQLTQIGTKYRLSHTISLPFHKSVVAAASSSAVKYSGILDEIEGHSW